MPSRSTGDPRLKTSEHKAHAKYFRGKRRPCARCGEPIDYTDRTKGPRSLVVGHIIGRDEGRRLGLTDADVDALSNKQPECATCSASSGAEYLAAKNRGTNNAPIHTREW